MRRPLDSWAPARRRLALVSAAVVVALVLGLVGWAVVRRHDEASPAEQGTPGAVILVPGYGGSTADLAPLVDELRAQGRTAVVFRPTGQLQGDLRVQARRLAALTRTTLDRTGQASVDLVGYSAGGVVVRLFVRDDGGAELARRVLTLGSPSHGAEVAGLVREAAGGCPTACEQLVPGSELLDRLNAGDETPAGPRWITLRSDSDKVVTPTDSAELRGALNLRVQDLCPAATTTHSALPGDPVALALLRSALGAAPPRRPTAVDC